MKFFKKNLKFLSGVIVGAVLASSITVYAYSYFASDVQYTSNKSVAEALDELYSRIPTGSEGTTKTCTLNISQTGKLSIGEVSNLTAFALIKDGELQKFIKGTQAEVMFSGSYSVIAIDDQLDVYKSNVVEYESNGLYLISDGNNSSESYAVKINEKSANNGVTHEWGNGALYMQSSPTWGDASSGYQTCQSSTKIDVTNYTKLYVRAKGSTNSGYPNIKLGLKDADGWESGTLENNITSSILSAPSDEYAIYEYDISSISGSYYVYVTCWNGGGNTYVDLYVADFWLAE